MKLRAIAWLGALSLSIAGNAVHADPASPVTTTGGKVEGEGRSGGVIAFLGIPYAAPPVGAGRWASPGPAKPWHGVRPAMASVPACAQPDMGWNSESARSSSEDCLYLNVYTQGTSGKRPVMVWIHGGGFTGGAGSSKSFVGVRLARAGVVLVTVNYRLGVFGLMTGVGDIPANLGLQDQVAALHWVQENIAGFGGDPANVTIFGQSAGGGSVMAHLSSPAARGLFERAIVESGASPRPLGATGLEAAARTALAFMDGKPLDWWRSQPTSAIIERYNAQTRENPSQVYRFGLVADGWTMVPPDKATQAAVPLMIGSNSREGFTPVQPDQLPAAIARAFGANAEQAAKYYAPGDDPVLGSPTDRLATDVSLRCGSILNARRHVSTGQPTWLYLFEQPLPGQEAKGAQHSDELQFLFGNFVHPAFQHGVSAEDRALSDRMIGYWTRFARSGNPNGDAAPVWPEFTAPDGPYLRFSTALPDDAQSAVGLRAGLCDLLDLGPR